MVKPPERGRSRLPSGIESDTELQTVLMERLNEIEMAFGNINNTQEFDIYRIVNELRITLINITHRLAENEANIKSNADDIRDIDEKLDDRNREFKAELSQSLGRIEKEIEKQMNLLNSSMQTVKGTVRVLEINDAERRPLSRLGSHVLTLMVTAIVTGLLALIITNGR